MDDLSHFPDPPDLNEDDRCPVCGVTLSDPQEGQTFSPIDIPTIDPSKVCEGCQVGYWLGTSGWLAVATLDV
jgi:uncharacterized protein with PIN domain